MVLTRRNRRQLGITPDLNEAELFRIARRILPAQPSPQPTPQPSPALSAASQGSIQSLGSLDINDIMGWYESMSQDQQERFTRWVKRYRPRDTAHRHRLDDAQPKDEVVRTYRRRKA